MKKNNILVTGANGQLGQTIRALSKNLSYNFFFTSKKDLDICNYSNLELFCKVNNINFIINCAAYTNVDNAEDDESNANNINALAVKNLAYIAKALEIKLIHISTDYVFDGLGCKPYKEIDNTNPLSVYGNSKLKGEHNIIKINPKNSIIIRTSWMYSEFGNNFVKTIINKAMEKQDLNVVFDQTGTPTYSLDLARAIFTLLPKIKNDETEIFHYSNEGVTSWYDIAILICKQIQSSSSITPTTSLEFSQKANRPHYSVLNKTKIKKLYNVSIPYWQDSLLTCTENIVQNIIKSN